MLIVEQRTIARPGDGIDVSAARPDRQATRPLGGRAARALRNAPWRRVLVTLCLASVGLAGQAAHVPQTHAAGNADAAHACQNGGYLNLVGSGSNGQTITFKNVGDCVSYAAHGGLFTTPLPACSVTPTTGCVILSGDTITSVPAPQGLGDGNSYTFTGAISFDDTCATGGCLYLQPSSSGNNLATGSGTYVEKNSSGTDEGLEFVAFASGPSTVSTCPAATYVRVVGVFASLVSSSGAPPQLMDLAAGTFSTGAYPNFLSGSLFTTETSFLVQDNFQGAITNAAITC